MARSGEPKLRDSKLPSQSDPRSIDVAASSDTDPKLSALLNSQQQQIEDLTNLLESRQQKIKLLSSLLGARDHRIMELTRKEATLATELRRIKSEAQKHLERAVLEARRRQQQFLHTPAGLAARIFFHAVLTLARATRFLVGDRLPRVRELCTYTESLLVAREWRTFGDHAERWLRKRRSIFLGDARRFYRDSLLSRLKPPIGVIVLAGEDEDLLDSTMRSIRGQTLARMEILILRQASNASSISTHNRYRAHAREMPVGDLAFSQLIKKGVDNISGTYVCFMRAGDEIAPTYLEKCMFMLEADPTLGMAYGQLESSEAMPARASGDFDARDPAMPVWAVPHAVFRRRTARRLRVPKRTGQAGESAFWAALARASVRGRAINQPLARYGPAERSGVAVAWPAHVRKSSAYVERRTPGPAARSRRRARFWMLASPSRRQDERRRLLVVVPYLVLGGSEMMLLDILRRLSPEWSITIVTTLRVAHELEAEFARLTADIFHMADLVPQEAIVEFITAIARSRRAQILLSHNSTHYYDALPELKRQMPWLKTIDILHNEIGHVDRAAKVSAAIGRHVAVSNPVAGALVKRGVPKGKISVIPNGVDIDEQFVPERVDRRQAKQKLDLKTDCFILAFVGRIAEEKRPWAFLEIVDTLRKTLPVQGLMVGGGPLADEIDAAIARDRMAVRRMPKIDRSTVHEIYAASDLLVLPSSVEGMPLVVLEALAMGCPVVATRVGDLGRVIVDGYNGYLVPSNDFRAMIPLIRDLACDPKRQDQLRSAARTSAMAAGVSLKSMTAQYVELLSS